MSLNVAGFTPSTRGPLFANGPWPPGTALQLSIPGLPAIPINATQMGLCGGMSFLTRDIFESGTPQLRGRIAADIPAPLAQLVLRRLIDSFGGAGTVAKWLQFTRTPDHDTALGGTGVFGLTVAECQAIMADVDAGQLSPIGVVLTQSLLPWAVFDNHVDLVWGYDLDGSQLTLRTYDCNFPGEDTITISLDISAPAPAKVISTNGTDGSNPGQIRGFFRLPYVHADPSAAYIDDAVVAISSPPPAQLAPGATAEVVVTATNTGSTSWFPHLGYRLGSQAPQDNLTWGLGRVDLPGPQTDPQDDASFRFKITAPQAAGEFDFRWQMLQENVHWFGTPSADLPVPVGADTPLCDQLHARYVALREQYQDLENQIAALGWNAPDKADVAAMARQAHVLQGQMAALESQQTDSGCAPG
jgi:hypothetical protein